MAERYDSILVRVEIGNSRKLRRLSPEQRWCVLAGVWALAAKAPSGLRGYLLVTPTEPITAQDVAEQAGVRVAVARSTLSRMRELGMLEPHEEGEYVHDWHEHQREPGKKPSDSPEETRRHKQEQRERARESHASVTRVTPGDVTPPDSTVSRPPIKEKGIEDPPPAPPGGSGRSRRVDQSEPPPDLPADLRDTAASVLPRLLQLHADRGGHEPTLRGVGMALVAHPNRDHLAVLGELEHWALAGSGQARSIRDWVAQYRNFLAKAPAGTPVRTGTAAERREARLAAIGGGR